MYTMVDTMKCPLAPIKQSKIKNINNRDGTCCRKLFADDDYIPLETRCPITQLSDEQLAYINRGRDVYEPVEYQLK